MRKELSKNLRLIGNRVLTILTVGTIVSVTIWAESLSHGFPGSVTVPILAGSAGGMLIFIPLFSVGFIEEFGAPIVTLLLARKDSFYDSPDLTREGEALARELRIKKKITFKVRHGLKTAYSVGKSVVVGEVFASSSGERRSVTAHELTHQTRYNYWGRLSRFFLFGSPAFLILVQEAWLPKQIWYPYALALMLFPLRQGFHWGEYHSDREGARVTSPESMIATLLHLRDIYGDAGSFTHPSISKRIKHLQEEFGQAH